MKCVLLCLFCVFFHSEASKILSFGRNCSDFSLDEEKHTRRLLWEANGIKGTEIIEPTGIPDPLKLEKVHNLFESVKNETAVNHNAAGVHKPNFGPTRMTIFTSPRPFVGQDDVAQRAAISSWLRLSPTPLVHLIGNHPSFYLIAENYGKSVVVEPNVDCSFNGIPLFNSMLSRAHVYKFTYTMVIAPDVILLSDIIKGLKFVRHNFNHFVMTAARTDIPPIGSPGVNFDSTFGPGFNEMEFTDIVRRYGRTNPSGNVGFWFWNNSPVPLVNASLLPFSFQRGFHDKWLAHEISKAGFRALVDVSDIVTCVHPKETTGRKKLYQMGEGGYEEKVLILRKWNSVVQSPEDLELNRQLAHSHWRENKNSFEEKLSKPLRMQRCKKKNKRAFCLVPVWCSIEPEPPSMDGAEPEITENESAQIQSTFNPHKWLCDLYLPTKPLLRSTHRLLLHQTSDKFHKLAALLPLVADNRRVVTLIASSSLYKDMLMSFVCMLRRLGLNNPLVGALDQEMYEFASAQGLPVFFDAAARAAGLQAAKNGSVCKYGTACFVAVTKLKSRIVLSVLRLGYSVLWSDIDVIWFRDPLVEILQYPNGTLPAQSDQWKKNSPLNGANRTSIPGGAINSGFYFARAEEKVISALEAIVDDAKRTEFSEQPSFYKVLCGKGRSTVGGDECVWKRNGLRTVFMPRDLHPNGKYNNIWHRKNTAGYCVSKGCATLHNNWIKGRQAKINRMRDKGLWYFDPNNRICLYKWYRKTRGLPLFATRTDDEAEEQS